MSTDVVTNGARFRARCGICEWLGNPTRFRERAEAEAEQHDLPGVCWNGPEE